MAKIRGANSYGEYLTERLSYSDYMAEENRVKGQWVGKLAEKLGLQGECLGAEDNAFRLLIDGLNPSTGKKLTQRVIDPEKAVRLFDFTCSAHKSVSVAALLAGDGRLVSAHIEAAKVALSEMERFSAKQTGYGKTHGVETTGNFCGAIFTHDSSRSLDPQLHTHCGIFNVTQSRDGKFFALETFQMVRAIRYAGKVYQNELAKSCLKLGYEIEEKRNEKGVVEGFGIKGIRDELCERFSKRTPQVEAALAEFRQKYHREPNAREWMIIKRKDRAAKLVNTSKESVRQYQMSQLSTDETKELRTLVDSARNRKVEKSASMEISALHQAVGHLFERASVLKGHEVLAETLNSGLGHLDLAQVKKYVGRGGAGLVQLNEGNSSAPLIFNEYATHEGIMLEKWAVAFVNQTKGTCVPFFQKSPVLASWLSDEQKRAVDFVLTGTDQVSAIRGVAGAGKTTMLKELHSHLNSPFLYLAPTASAVQVLKGEGIQNALTISDYLNRAESGSLLGERGTASNSLLIVDEAGLQSNKQGVAILRLAKVCQNRVLFVGDSRQHVSIEAGDFLRVLETYSQISSVELVDIRRQKTEEYNQAVRLMASGHVDLGVDMLDRMGWIHEKPDYLLAAADEYLRLTGEKKEVLCVTPTWSENEVVTDAIRSGLKASGQLKDFRQMEVVDPLKWTNTQKSWAENFAPGMVVSFNRKVSHFQAGENLKIQKIADGLLYFEEGRTLQPKTDSQAFDVARCRLIEISVGDKILIRANDRKAGLVNGEVLTVSKIENNGIQTVEGKVIPQKFPSFTHGYVITSYKSQGRTADVVVAAAASLDARTAYVALSRGRWRCSLFTPSKESLMNGLPRSVNRKAVLDVLGSPTVKPKKKEGRFARFNRNLKKLIRNMIRVHRFNLFQKFIRQPRPKLSPRHVMNPYLMQQIRRPYVNHSQNYRKSI